MAQIAVDATAVAPAAKGIGRVATGAVEALADRGIDVVALAPRGARLAAPVAVARPRPAILWEQFGLARAARRHHVVLSFTDRLPLLGGGRFVIWLFEVPTRRLQENRRARVGAYRRGSDLVTALLGRRSVHRAALVLAGSHATAAELRTAVPELGAVTVVHPGLDSRFSPGEETGAPNEFLLHLGSADPRDNTRVVLESFKRVRALTGRSIRLVVAGGANGPEESGVDWVGRVSDDELLRLYRQASVFVDASLYEGFGYGPLEAMACGTPVVGANTPAGREVAGDAALLCDPADGADFAANVVRVLEDGALAAQLRERGLARARSFSWTRACDALIEALERVW
jgi:glycosyltransferase involved in cell wall biosynthesis